MRIAVAALALPLVAGVASPAWADVGVVVKLVGQGLDPAAARSVASNIEQAVKTRVVPLGASDACDVADERAPCIEPLVAASPDRKDIDEVAVVVLERRAPGATHMSLRVVRSEDWKKTALKVEGDVPDVDSTNAAKGIVRQVFDPGRYTGRLVVEGAPARAEILVDGLAAEPLAVLSVGKHHVLVVSPDGTAFQQDVVIAYQQHTRLPVPALGDKAAGPRPTWPFFVADAVLAAGVATAVIGALVEEYSVRANADVGNNIDAWSLHARDTVGFLPKGDQDPACPPSPKTGACDKGSAWTTYGPASAGGVSEPAHFAMTAVARQNELSWRAGETAAITSIIVGSSVAVAGGVAAIATFVAAQPDEAAQ